MYQRQKGVCNFPDCADIPSRPLLRYLIICGTYCRSALTSTILNIGQGTSLTHPSTTTGRIRHHVPCPGPIFNARALPYSTTRVGTESGDRPVWITYRVMLIDTLSLRTVNFKNWPGGCREESCAVDLRQPTMEQKPRSQGPRRVYSSPYCSTAPQASHRRTAVMNRSI